MEKFTISECAAGKFRFSLLSRAGVVILTSDGHNSREICLIEINKVRKFSQDRQRFDKQLLTTGKLCFNLEATNGCILAVGPVFDQFSDMIMGIDCVIKYGQAANVEDLTFHPDEALSLQLA